MKPVVHTRLRQIRLSKEMTCGDIADVIGISKTYYWQMENGKRCLSYALAYEISKTLGMKPDEVFYEEYKKYRN